MSEQVTYPGLDGVTFTATYYGSLALAHGYFQSRLHEKFWTKATNDNRRKALYAATIVLDALNYKGKKHTVHELSEDATEEEIRAAEASQVLEFPRGADTEEPEAIKIACFEIAHSLLEGKDPEKELEALGVTSQGFSSVRSTYNRQQVPIEHLINGIPNSLAWRLIRPFLRDSDAIRLTRVS